MGAVIDGSQQIRAVDFRCSCERMHLWLLVGVFARPSELESEAQMQRIVSFIFMQQFPEGSQRVGGNLPKALGLWAKFHSLKVGEVMK
jgi:hypothetical protein